MPPMALHLLHPGAASLHPSRASRSLPVPGFLLHSILLCWKKVPGLRCFSYASTRDDLDGSWLRRAPRRCSAYPGLAAYPCTQSVTVSSLSLTPWRRSLYYWCCRLGQWRHPRWYFSDFSINAWPVCLPGSLGCRRGPAATCWNLAKYCRIRAFRAYPSLCTHSGYFC